MKEEFKKYPFDIKSEHQVEILVKYMIIQKELIKYVNGKVFHGSN
ncbi:hypothetical protein [Clostridium sp. Cult3]|jgi:hypothetical protein|nr:hypothetical protein [Clostridium sp. Cult3]